MDSLVYVAVLSLSICANVAATIMIEKYKKKGLIQCEKDLRGQKYI